MPAEILDAPRAAGSGWRLLLGRAALVAMALTWFHAGGMGGRAWGAPLPPAGSKGQEWQQQRQWLLQRNQVLQERLELSRRCLQAADSAGALERCRQSDGRPYGMPMHGTDSRGAPWQGCPLW